MEPKSRTLRLMKSDLIQKIVHITKKPVSICGTVLRHYGNNVLRCTYLQIYVHNHVPINILLVNSLYSDNLYFNRLSYEHLSQLDCLWGGEGVLCLGKRKLYLGGGRNPVSPSSPFCIEHWMYI